MSAEKYDCLVIAVSLKKHMWGEGEASWDSEGKAKIDHGILSEAVSDRVKVNVDVDGS